MASRKSAPAPLTLDEQIQAAAARRDADSYATARLPVPAKPFSLGDEVYLGHIDDAVVVGLLDAGRRVAVQHTPVRSRDATGPIQKVVQVVPFFDLQLKSVAADEDFSRPNHYILNYSQRDISGLMHLVTHSGVDMNPEYQRGLVWDESDKVRLIESLFNQVDIGKFVFRRLPFQSGGASYEIVDGKQRLGALIDFMADKFAYQGKTWSQLSRTDRNYLESYNISYAELAQDYTRAQILDLFVRLNTGGKPMDPAHLEKVARMAKEDAPSTAASGPKR